MLFLLALPVFLAVATTHRYLALYAPSNVLIRHVRTSRPCWRTVGALVVLTAALLLTMRTVDLAINAGAPGWLNLIALVLAWDAVKVVALAMVSALRCLTRGRKRSTTLDAVPDSGQSRRTDGHRRSASASAARCTSPRRSEPATTPRKRITSRSTTSATRWATRSPDR